MAFHVTPQRSCRAKRFATHETGERSLARVGFPVGHHIAVLGEPFVANITLERPLARMDRLVPTQMALRDERHAAVEAGERLLAGVTAHVHNQLWVAAVSFAAHLAHKHVLSDLAVI